MWQHASATGETLDKDTLNKIVWDTGTLVADRVAFANEMGLDGGAFVDVFGRVRGDCMTFMSQDQLLRTALSHLARIEIQSIGTQLAQWSEPRVVPCLNRESVTW
jgi:hypothetical protein